MSHHRGTRILGNRELLRQLRREIAHEHTEISARNTSLRPQLRKDFLHRIHRNREPDSLGALIDRIIDSDDLTFKVHQRATGITGVNRRVRLKVLRPGQILDLPLLRRNDPVSNGVSLTERIPHRDDILTDLERIGVTHYQRNHIALAAHLDQGEVKLRIPPHHFAISRLFVRLLGELDLDLIGARDDVVVRQDEATRIDDEAGS